MVEPFFAADAAGAFAVVDLLAVDFAAVVLVAVVLAAVDLAAVDLAAVDLAAVDFAVELRLAGAFAAVLVAAVLLVVDVPVAFFAADVVFAVAGRVVVDFVAAAVEAALLVAAAFVVVVVALGSFSSPDTYFFSCAPARNLGTAVFLARLRSPVRGLRTMREGRATFSKAPKPVMATFSPLTSSRWMTSMTEVNALLASFLLPS